MNIRLKDLFGCMALNTKVQLFIEYDDGKVSDITDIETIISLYEKIRIQPTFTDYYVVGITHFIDHINILISKEGER